MADDPQAMKQAEALRERALHRLAASMYYWICPTWPVGRPHTAPLWGVWLDGALHFGKREQKARNPEWLPYAIAHIDSNDGVAMVAGTVTPIDDREGIWRILEAEHERYGIEVTEGSGPFRYYRMEPEDGWAWLDNTTVKVDACRLDGPSDVIYATGATNFVVSFEALSKKTCRLGL